MKKVFLFAFILLSAKGLFAQTSFAEITREADGTKIVKGFLTKTDLASDTAFAWFAQGQKSYKPSPEVVKNLSAGKDAVNIVVFGGTWCGDTKQLLPNFFAATDAAGIANNRITLIGVDRNKKTLHNLTEAFNIVNVPTFIVMKDGKEVGRVVEYGKTGTPEKEVAELVAGIKK